MSATCVIQGTQTASLRVRVKSLKPKPPIQKEAPSPTPPPAPPAPKPKAEPAQPTPPKTNKKTSETAETQTLLSVILANIWIVVAIAVIVVFVGGLGIWAINSGKQTAEESVAKSTNLGAQVVQTVIHESPTQGESLAPSAPNQWSTPVRIHPGRCIIWDAAQIEIKHTVGEQQVVAKNGYYTDSTTVSTVEFRSTLGVEQTVGWIIYPLAHEMCARWKK